jgi:hypothetical protein
MSQSPEKTGVETPAIESLVKLGYTHLPGHTVQVEHRHLPQCLRMCCIPDADSEPVACHCTRWSRCGHD